MRNSILIVFFLLIQNILLANEVEHHSLIVKAFSKDGLVKTRLMPLNPTSERKKANIQKYEEIKKGRVLKKEANLISHISAKVENEIVFDMSFNPLYLYSTVYKFRDIYKGTNVQYIITDNEKNKKKLDFKFNRRNEQKIPLSEPIPNSKNSVIKFRKTKPKIWRSNNIQQAITELYGSNIDIIEDKINLKIPKNVVCNHQIVISISSNMDLESLAIFVDKVPGITLAAFSFSRFSVIDYKLGLSLYNGRPLNGKKYTVTIVGKSRDGKFYKATSKGFLSPDLTYDSCL